MRDLVELLVSYEMATPDTITPCTPAEIERVRLAQRVDRLPTQYEQFLAVVGRRAGDLLRGSTFFCPGIVELADDMRHPACGQSHRAPGRAGSIFVGAHQGSRLYWLTPGEPSGELYWYEEGEAAPGRRWPPLLTFLTHRPAEEKLIGDRYGRGRS